MTSFNHILIYQILANSRLVTQPVNNFIRYASKFHFSTGRNKDIQNLIYTGIFIPFIPHNSVLLLSTCPNNFRHADLLLLAKCEGNLAILFRYVVN